MSAADLQAPAFTDENTAREAIEALMWPKGPVCPHCGNVDQAKIGKVQGKSARAGLYYCGACKSQFTVTVGTIFERSKVPLSKWWLAIHLLASGKKGTSSHQLHRLLGVSYQTAWFMTHRIREAMRDDGTPSVGGEGEIIEADETFVGHKKGAETKRGYHHKNAVLTLVERGGSARSFHIEAATGRNIAPIIAANAAKESRLMTDEATYYVTVGKQFASHHSVQHTLDQYGYTDKTSGARVHTNTVEGFFSIFKRGMKGVYQHCGENTFTAISRSSIFAIRTAPSWA
jgi:transposase-like protein